MKTLILDTSSNYLYLFMSNEKENYEVVLEGRNNHSEKLMDLIEAGLLKLNIEVKDLDNIICGIGPGSYTGLRVGLTVCKVFAWTCKIPLYTISSLDILGSGYFKKEGKYAICNTAKKDYFYTKVFSVSSEVSVIQEDRFVLKDEFLKEMSKGINLVLENDFKFDSEIIKKLAFKNEPVSDIHQIVPNYLRKANS